MVKIKKPVTFHDNPMVVTGPSRPPRRSSPKKSSSSTGGDFTPSRNRSRKPARAAAKSIDIELHLDEAAPGYPPAPPEPAAPMLDVPFNELMLSSETLAHLETIGFHKPTQVQIQVIPAVFMGRDVVACAQTGTGKTASFALPMIDLMDSHRSRARMPRSLVLVPTRELAVQVAAAFEQFGQQKLSFVSIIGGSSITDQEKKLDRGVDVIIATPGRLLDLINRGKILLSDIKYLVVDEADRMLDMGFIPDIEKILSLLPPARQTMLFSATLPDAVRKLIKTFLVNPKQVSISPEKATASTIEQFWLTAGETQKQDAIMWIMANEKATLQSLFIFCNRKRDVDSLVKTLTRGGNPAVGLHGDMHQHVRTQTLQKFRDGRANILVASDVAARGIDVDTVSHVINLNIPVNLEDYVHRIGRTGRAGKSGKAYTLVGPRETAKLLGLQKMTGNALQKVTWSPLEASERPVAERPQEKIQERTPRSSDENRARTDRRRGRSAPRSQEVVNDVVNDVETTSAPVVEEPRVTPQESGMTERPRDNRRFEPRPQRQDQRYNGQRQNERTREPQPTRVSRPGPYDSDDIEDKPVAGFGSQTPSFFKKI